MTNSVTRLFDIILFQEKVNPQQKILRYKHKGIYQSITTKQFVANMNNLSNGLLKMDVKKGDCIVLVSPNRWEWHLIDMAISQIGAICVPLYPNISHETYRHILEEVNPKIIFVASGGSYTQMKIAIEKTKKSISLFTLDAIKGESLYTQLLHESKSLDNIVKRRNDVNPDDLLTIIYTSGTEGIPKGVMLSHHNILANIKAIHRAVPELSSKDIALTFLPLNHIYEKTVSYLFLYLGCQVNYAESLATIVEDAKLVNPTVFTCVPLILKKVYDKINATVETLHGLKKHLLRWAIALTKKWEKDKQPSLSYSIQHWLADKLIYKKWRQVLGGKIRIIPSGSAAINPSIIQFFNCAGIHLLEGYGLTETSPVVSVNLINANKFKLGTVGPLLDNVQVKIAKDGEILVKGESVMMGYYNCPEETAKVLSKDGWFKTGDIGEMVDNTYLKIIDRKKELFKTTSGKYIAPQYVENKIKDNPLVEQVMVMGSNQDFVSAIIQPNWELLTNWSIKNDLQTKKPEDLIKEKLVVKLFDKFVANANKNLSSHERVNKIKLVPDTWSVETGELTPTLKLKRRVIIKKYQPIYDSIYAS